jgi:hypothetical protein
VTVRFTCPRSDVLPTTRQDAVVWARHGLIGATGARSWGAYALGGEQFCWVLDHGGSTVDPRQDVDALADALADDNLAIVTLGAGDQDSQAVAEAIAAELISAFGHDASTDSVNVDGQTRYRVTVAGASAGLVGSPSSTKGVTSQCGIHDGSRRDGDGAVAGTLYIHTQVRAYNRDGTAVPDGTRCRITGIGYFGSDALRPRLGVALGPAHSLTPANVGAVVDAGRPATGIANGYDPIELPLPIAIPCVVGDDAWMLVRDDGGTGSLHYRFNASSGWHGDLDTSEDLLVEGSTDDPDVAFPSSTHTPTISANFAVHSMVHLIVECDDPDADDGSGFAGDGSIWAEIGCRRDAAGDTPTEDEPAGEVFCYRMLTPPFSRAAWVEVRYGLAAVDAAEDMSAAFYSWDVLDAAGATATRLGTSGLLGWDDGTPDAYSTTTLPARVPCGDDVVSDPYVSFGFTGGLIAGGAPTALQIQFDVRENGGADFGVDAEQLYNQGASPDLLVSDWVVGGLRELAEYVSQGSSTMPINAPAGTWPASWDFSGSNSLPGNLGRAVGVIAEQSATADVFAVETVADGTSASLAVGLELSADASLVVLASASLGVGLDVAADASVAVGASARVHVGLGLRVGGAPAGVLWAGDATEAVPMATLIDLLQGSSAAGKRPTGLAFSAGSSTAVALTAEVEGVGQLLVGGGLSCDADGTVTFYDGDPDDSGTSLGAFPVAAGVVLPLGVVAAWSARGSGRAVWAVSEDGTISGRAVAVQI